MESKQSLTEKLSIHFPSADEQKIAREIIDSFREDAKATSPTGYKGPKHDYIIKMVHERLGKYDIKEIEEIYNYMLAQKFIHSLDPKKIRKNQHYALGPLVT